MKKIAALFVGIALAASAWAYVDVGGMGVGQTSEWLVTNAAGGSTLTNLTARRALYLQNLGPNAIYCVFGTQTPLATGAMGIKIDPGSSFSISATDNVPVKCIAASAAQVTTAATQVVELI